MEQAAEASRAGLRSRRERIITVARPILQTSVAASAAWLIATEVVGPRAALLRADLGGGHARPHRRRAPPPRRRAGHRRGGRDRDRRPAGGRDRHRHLADRRGLRPRDARRDAGRRRPAARVAGRRLGRAGGHAPAARGLRLRPRPRRAGGRRHGARGRLAAAAGRPAAAGARGPRAGAGPPRRGAATRSPTRSSTATPARPSARSRRSAGSTPRYDHLAATLAAAGEAARISLGRRGTLSRLDRYVAAVGEVGLAIENVRALARGAMRAITLDDCVPPEVVAAIRELASAARELGRLLEGATRSRRARPPCAPCGSRTPCWRRPPTCRRSTSSARSAWWRGPAAGGRRCRAPRPGGRARRAPEKLGLVPGEPEAGVAARSRRPPSGPSGACPRSPSSSTASA